jgi:hypothetical protein
MLNVPLAFALTVVVVITLFEMQTGGRETLSRSKTIALWQKISLALSRLPIQGAKQIAPLRL